LKSDFEQEAKNSPDILDTRQRGEFGNRSLNLIEELSPFKKEQEDGLEKGEVNKEGQTGNKAGGYALGQPCWGETSNRTIIWAGKDNPRFWGGHESLVGEGENQLDMR